MYSKTTTYASIEQSGKNSFMVITANSTRDGFSSAKWAEYFIEQMGWVLWEGGE